MAKKITGPQILTANLLSDGMVVFLNPNGSWASSLEGAHVAHSDDDAARLEANGGAAARANIVVDPYLIEVEVTSAAPFPVEFRERMRARGPGGNVEFISQTSEQAALAG